MPIPFQIFRKIILHFQIIVKNVPYDHLENDSYALMG